jgi:serine/threonine-protein kinase
MNMQPVFASDLYALGVTCIYLLTGRSPKSIGYHPVTGELLWRQHVHVNDAFAWILQKLLAVAVDRRYQSADQVLRALDRTTARQQRSGSRMISLPQKNAVPFSYQNTLAICQFMTGFPAADQLCFQCG